MIKDHENAIHWKAVGLTVARGQVSADLSGELDHKRHATHMKNVLRNLQ